MGLEQPYQTLSRQGAQHNVDLATEVPSFATAPDIVVHAAGKAHSTPKTAEQAQTFFDVNLTGTQNLLRGARARRPLTRRLYLYQHRRRLRSRQRHRHPGNAPPGGRFALRPQQAPGGGFCADLGPGKRRARRHRQAAAGGRGRIRPAIWARWFTGSRRAVMFVSAWGATRKSVVLAADIAGILPALAARGGVYNLTDGQPPSFAELEETICPPTRPPPAQNPCRCPWRGCWARSATF